eukprot:757649-Hanusia_phi.AAC.1
MEEEFLLDKRHPHRASLALVPLKVLLQLLPPPPCVRQILAAANVEQGREQVVPHVHLPVPLQAHLGHPDRSSLPCPLLHLHVLVVQEHVDDAAESMQVSLQGPVSSLFHLRALEAGGRAAASELGPLLVQPPVDGQAEVDQADTPRREPAGEVKGRKAGREERGRERRTDGQKRGARARARGGGGGDGG